MSFTPSSQIDPSKEKDWAVGLGMIDWDSTNIVFTKRSLLEFLKYTGTTVDTNLFNIQKLPSMSSQDVLQTRLTTHVEYAVFGKFDPALPKPGEKLVNSAAAGDASSAAPPNPVEATLAEAEEEEQGIQFSSAPRPSRRVREAPGGKDSLSSLWGEETNDEFRPTRRVREGPGGTDSISSIF